MNSLEMEPVLVEKEDSKETTQQPRNPLQTLQAIFELLKAYIYYYRFVPSLLVAVAGAIFLVFLLEAIAYRSTAKYRVPKLTYEVSELNDLYQMRMKQLDHWCQNGDDRSCRCMDPSDPVPRDEEKNWPRAHGRNKNDANNWKGAQPDVVFVGDETIEELNGRWLGHPRPPKMHLPNPHLEDIKNTFQSVFRKHGKRPLALGIAGDNTNNVIWRIQHGEMPPTLDPKVWWITVGSQDVGKMQCSVDATLLGLLYLAEEIKEARPHATVVINSILPRNPPPHIKNIWPAVQAVNGGLREWANVHDHVEYFDATPLFFRGREYKWKGLKQEMFTDQNHLTPEGHRIWTEAVVKEVDLILGRGNVNKTYHGNETNW